MALRISRWHGFFSLCVCMCVCVCARARTCVCVCVCAGRAQWDGSVNNGMDLKDYNGCEAWLISPTGFPSLKLISRSHLRLSVRLSVSLSLSVSVSVSLCLSLSLSLSVLYLSSFLNKKADETHLQRCQFFRFSKAILP